MRTSMLALAALTLAAATPLGASAQPMAMSAKLAPAPGAGSSGSGTATLSLDMTTKVLTYKIEYSGLTGPATAAHIHGPAQPGANAPPVIPFANAASPITGTATLTDAQMADLHNGLYYVNIHTAANRGGEIRGQIQ